MNTNIIELPKKTHEIASFLWVIKALSKDKRRGVINLLHVEKAMDKTGGTLVCATDGRRLHIARIADNVAEPGDYKIMKATLAQFIAVRDESGMTFPKVLCVVPENKPEDATKITLLYARYDSEFIGQRLFDMAVKFHGIKQTNFNVNYLDEATNGLNDVFAWQRDEVSPVLIKDTNDEAWTRLAVVMPCRVN